jgi:hypothetical protein
MTLSPAYGRDYKSKKAVQADFEEGKDFIICDIMSPYDGRPANKQNMVESGYKQVNIRYNKLRKVCVIKI